MTKERTNTPPNLCAAEREHRTLATWADARGLCADPHRANITLLTTRGLRATKRVTKAGVENFASAKHYFALPLAIHELDTLISLLEQLTHASFTLAVLEVPKPGQGFTRLRRIKDGFDHERGREWLWLDIDDIEAPADIDPTSPEAIGWFARNVLPPELVGVRGVAMFTSKAGLAEAGHKLKLRIIYRLDQPQSANTLRQWGKARNAEDALFQVDTALFSAVQAHYTAAPVFEGRADPFDSRSRIVEIAGERETVSADALAKIAARQAPHAPADFSRPADPKMLIDTIDNELRLIRDENQDGRGLHDGINVVCYLFVRRHGAKPSRGAVDALARRVRHAALHALVDGRLTGRPRKRILDDTSPREIRRSVEGAIDKGFALRIPSDAPSGWVQARRKLRSVAAGKSQPAPTHTLMDYAYAAAIRARARLGVEFSADDLAMMLAADTGRALHPAIKLNAERFITAVKQQQCEESGLAGLDVPVHQIEHLHEAETLDDGLTFIRAPMATGKTKISATAFGARHPGAGYLTHRRALARTGARRLALAYYRVPVEVDTARLFGSGAAGVVNSLPFGPFRAFAHETPAWIVDEIEQVVRHLAGDAVPGRHKKQVFTEFAQGLSDRPCLLLDAGLNTFAVNAVRALAPNTPVRVYEMKRPRDGFVRLLTPCGAQNALAAAAREIRAGAAEGERLIVTTDRKSWANTVAETLNNDGVRCGLITADVPAAEREAFFADPDGLPRERGWQCFIYTPAIAAGVSLESENFDRVYGLYTGVVAPADFLQQLFRYRPATEWTLAIACRAPDERMEAGDRIDALEQLDRMQHADDTRALDDVSRFVSTVQAREAEMRAWFGLKVLTALEEMGLRIQRQPTNESALDAVQKEQQAIAVRLREQREEAVLNAARLSHEEAREYQRRGDLSADELAALSRYRVCRTLALADSDTLSAHDLAFLQKHRHAARTINRFSVTRWEEFDIREVDKLDPAAVRGFLMEARAFFRDALRALGIDLVTGEGDWTKQQAPDTLAPVFETHAAITRRLGLKIARQKPMRAVRAFLDRIGLKSERIGGQRSGRYRVDPESWARMVIYATDRARAYGTPGVDRDAGAELQRISRAREIFAGVASNDPAALPGWLANWLDRSGAALLTKGAIQRATGCSRNTAAKRRNEVAEATIAAQGPWGTLDSYTATFAGPGKRAGACFVVARRRCAGFPDDAEPSAEERAAQICAVLERETGWKVENLAAGKGVKGGRFIATSIKGCKTKSATPDPLTIPRNTDASRDLVNSSPTPATSTATSTGTSSPEPQHTLRKLLQNGGISTQKASRFHERGRKYRRRRLDNEPSPAARAWLAPDGPEADRLKLIALGIAGGDIARAGAWIKSLTSAQAA